MSEPEKIGPLKKWKHEAYAQARASGLPMEKSSESAGLSGDSGNAAMLENNPMNCVQKRIAEIRASGFKASDIDAEFIIGNLAHLAADSMTPAAVQSSSLKTLADIAGLRAPRFKGDEGMMTREERDELLRRLLKVSQADLKPLIDITPEATKSKVEDNG